MNAEKHVFTSHMFEIVINNVYMKLYSYLYDSILVRGTFAKGALIFGGPYNYDQSKSMHCKCNNEHGILSLFFTLFFFYSFE